MSENWKLIRHRIPEIVKDKGETIETSIVEDENELIYFLKKKLIEEAIEISEATDKDHITEEIADLKEVIDELMIQLKIKSRSVIWAQEEKIIDKGTFSKGILLKLKEK